MEEIQELAGNLKAELLEAKDDFQHGRIDKAAYLKRIQVIKGRRETAQAAYHTRTMIRVEPQALLSL